MDEQKELYLRYKKKYLELKKTLGGADVGMAPTGASIITATDREAIKNLIVPGSTDSSLLTEADREALKNLIVPSAPRPDDISVTEHEGGREVNDITVTEI